MLQQTPVARVLPTWRAWMNRWPTPADLAASPTSEVIRAWDRLGYPRRAIRLHRAAQVIVADHGGFVPSDLDALLSLPGVGEYTAGAVRAFAFDIPALTLDTNVRRVLARYLQGQALPTGQVTRAERELTWSIMPADGATKWMAGLMELGALVCTAKKPDCNHCPLVTNCAWVAAGSPPPVQPPRRQPQYVGSDRQARGHILAMLRNDVEALDLNTIRAGSDYVWADEAQAERALSGLASDGLINLQNDGKYCLPN
jgi:A/G-specific adenine glycosylase